MASRGGQEDDDDDDTDNLHTIKPCISGLQNSGNLQDRGAI